MSGPGSKLVLAALAAPMLGGCASVAPLAETPGLEPDIAMLQVPSATPMLPGLKPHPVSLADGLDETEAAMLAVVNNPELGAARARAGLAGAQLFAAGLLPDPQVSMGLDKPAEGAGLVTAYNIGLGFDLASLITYDARRDEGRAAAAQARLDLVWAEWQVAQQARVLHRKLVGTARIQELLHEYEELSAARQARSARALDQGDITLDQAASDLVALLDVRSRLHDQELDLIETRQAFRGLLGLEPDAPLPQLDSGVEATPLDLAALEAALAGLPQRRPDLRALAAGYAAQDARLRAAVLNRFPNLSLAASRARDTAGLRTTGLGVTLSLPFLDGNRGAIRVERATGEQLRAEYAARLAQAHAEIRRLQLKAQTLRAQVVELQDHLPGLAALTGKAQRGADRQDLDPLVYLTLRASLLAKRIEVEARTQALAEAEVLLSTLLGVPPDALADVALEQRESP